MVTREVFFRSGFNYDGDAVSDETGLRCNPDECITQQQFAEECDINTIVKRFGLTGELPGDFRAPVSGDFTDVTDYKSAMDAVTAAQSEFMRMPASLRARFENNPQRLVEFVGKASNRAEAIELGLIPRPREVARDGTPVPVGEAGKPAT